MSALRNNRLVLSPNLLSAAAGPTASLVGFLVLLGWLFRLPGLRGLHSALSPMGPRAAFCFVFAGAALWLLRAEAARPWKRLVAQASTTVAIVASLLALGQSWFEWTPHIDSLLFKIATGTILPGRMPTATALAFLSIGLALLLLDVEIRRLRPAEFLSFAAVLIVILALVGYGYGFVSFFDITPRRPLAIHTLFAFLMLSLGILMAHPRVGLMSLATSNSVGGVMVRRLWPAAVGIPVLAGWLITEGQRAKLYPPVLDLAFYTLAIIVVFSALIWLTAGSLHRIDIQRRQAEEQIRKLNAELEQRVVERTAQLEAANRELEAFSYSVSHDLRAPLRAIDGFSRILLEDCSGQLGEEGKNHLDRVCKASHRMGQLIDDLLSLARVTRNHMCREAVDFSAVANAVVTELRREDPERPMQVAIKAGLRVNADANLMRIVLENLVGNAWKFTRKGLEPRIEVSALQQGGEMVYLVRDNGAGFDMAYADKLFRAFQRLHEASEFEGTGIGLATVQRIIHRHGGRVWAEGAVGQGATFYFTLP